MEDIKIKLDRLVDLLYIKEGFPEFSHLDIEKEIKIINLELNRIIYKNGVSEEIKKRYEDLLRSFSEL